MTRTHLATLGLLALLATASTDEKKCPAAAGQSTI